MADGVSNGTPPLASHEQYRQWHEVMTCEYQRLIDDAEFGHATLLDVYGATNVAEFFAVATEAFFERAEMMRRFHPALYGVLQVFYGQDPAEWRG
jgi:Mlc titration factor MtfA (ptsG expression regulator)